MKTACLSIVILLAAALGGCATSGPPDADPRSVAGAADPTTLNLFRGDGTPASWEEVIAACAGAEAVLIGECHGQEVGQAFQARLFADLIAKAPTASGALEFFERDEQAALDDYLRGVTNETEFRRAARRTDSNYTAGHRAMVEACRAARRPVLAANAPRRYVRIARQDGFERLRGLTLEQQRLFVLPESLPEGRYRDDFFKVMGGEALLEPRESDKPADPKQAEADERQRENIASMLRSQSVWDWTMANSVAEEIDRGGRPVVLIVGRFHIDHGGGLVQALRKMRPDTKIVTITNIDRWSGSLREDDRAIADFAAYIGD